MEKVARDPLWRQQLFSLWFAVFGIAAVILTAVGIYGVLAYLVWQRGQEIGIRMALGADRRRVLLMVLRQGAMFVGAGSAVGLVGAYLLARAMRGLLFGVEPLDSALFVVVTAFLAAIAMAASIVPAVRAARIDPNALLRG
jgi:ABC-type antimicrobial peptide transport system permease subunit